MKDNKLMIEKAWDIRIEGKINKNNIVFQDQYYRLYKQMKKVNDKLKEKK
tara:strand:- start:324 stop:473 length:150 start_codon:yes stop_codon:yes gene_type:complete